MQCIKCKKEIPDGSSFCNHCGKKQTAEKRRSRRRANGQGSVVKLSGKRAKPYAVTLPARYNEDGECRRSYYGYYETKTEALNALNAVISCGITDRINATMSDIYTEWSETAFKDLSNKSIKAYKTAYKHLEPLHDSKMRDVKANAVQDIIDALGKPEGGKKIRVLFSQLCKYAMSQDIITQNYSQFIKIRAGEKAEKEIFTPEEIKKLRYAAYDSDTAKIILMMIFSGTRIGEITSIKRDNVHLGSETPYMIGGIKTEAGKNRIIPIHPYTISYAEYFYNKNEGKKYLLTNEAGHKIDADNFRKRDYYPLLADLEIKPKSPHCTRHTYTSMLHAAGAKEENVIKLVGHTDFRTTTENYIHQSVGELYETVNLLKI